LQRGWNFFRSERNESFDILPASQRIAEDRWYVGTADAVYQNIDIIESAAPKYMLVLAGDHVYKMDFEAMLQQHVASGADVTVGCIEIPRGDASGFGIMQVDAADRILAFLEKPADPPSLPGRPDTCLASMGIYVFETKRLIAVLREDAEDTASSHDFGRDIIPRLVETGGAVAHPFSRSCVRSSAEALPYWRDVGTLDSYFAANIDLTDVVPQLDLFDQDWPLWTYAEMTAPAKFVHDEATRRGTAIASVLAGGTIISGATLRRSLVFSRVHVHSYADISYAVILPEVQIGRHARLRHVIIEHGVRIPPGLVVGEDPVLDAQRFRRTANGVCLINQGMIDRL
jgi:glucose-1-phosphate adenylyltransferase